MEASLSNKSMRQDVVKYAAIFFIYQLLVQYFGSQFVIVDAKTTNVLFLAVSIYAYHTFVAPYVASLI